MTLFLVLAMASLITWGLRIAFITVVPACKLPVPLQRSLEHVGPAVMGAMVVTDLSHQQALTDPAAAIPALPAVLVSGAVAWKTHSFALTVLAGIAVFGVLQLIV